MDKHDLTGTQHNIMLIPLLSFEASIDAMCVRRFCEERPRIAAMPESLGGAVYSETNMAASITVRHVRVLACRMLLQMNSCHSLKRNRANFSVSSEIDRFHFGNCILNP